MNYEPHAPNLAFQGPACAAARWAAACVAWSERSAAVHRINGELLAGWWLINDRMVMVVNGD